MLPLAIPILAFLAQSAWLERAGGWWTALGLAMVTFIALIVFSVVYWINQMAVRCELLPRRQELDALHTTLKDETTVANG